MSKEFLCPIKGKDSLGVYLVCMSFLKTMLKMKIKVFSNAFQFPPKEGQSQLSYNEIRSYYGS